MEKQAANLEQAVCALVCRSRGLRAKEIADRLGVERKAVNRVLYASPLLHELCYPDSDFRWHGILRQTRPHAGLREYAGFYSLVSEFRTLSEEEWLAQLSAGCERIGRNLNDTRGLLHSFRDCRETMRALFDDLASMVSGSIDDWEIAFELRLKRAKHVRIYADVLVVTDRHVFSLEFKMKDEIEPVEVEQAAKYCPYLEIVFGPDYEVVPALVLTKAKELFCFEPIGGRDAVLPVASGDMLFNVFNEYMGFLDE